MLQQNHSSRFVLKSHNRLIFSITIFIIMLTKLKNPSRQRKFAVHCWTKKSLQHKDHLVQLFIHPSHPTPTIFCVIKLKRDKKSMALSSLQLWKETIFFSECKWDMWHVVQSMQTYILFLSLWFDELCCVSFNSYFLAIRLVE